MKKFFVCCKMFPFLKAILKFCTAEKYFKNIYLNLDEMDSLTSNKIEVIKYVHFSLGLHKFQHCVNKDKRSSATNSGTIE